MSSEQRWRIEQEIEQFKKLRQSETDRDKQQRLEQRIYALERELELLAQQKQNKASVHISQVDAGRDITVGGNHHHYYPSSPLQEQISKHWWKLLLGLIGLFLLVWGLLRDQQHHQRAAASVFTSPPTASASQKLVFKFRDAAGRRPLRNAGKAVLSSGRNEQVALIDSLGHASFRRDRFSNQLHLRLHAEGYQLVVPDSSYQLDSAGIEVLIAPLQKPMPKSTPASAKPRNFIIISPSPKAALHLRQGLLKATNWQSLIAEEPDLQIEMNHSGTFTKISNQLYRYSNGYLQISVNGVRCCCEEERYKIELGGSKYGNPFHLIEERIIDTMYQQINQHLDDVIVKIKNCTM